MTKPPDKMPWFKFYPSDWLTGTRGLSVVETGVYITLMASMYEREAPVENDTQELSRLCGCTQKQLIPALEKLISKGKIILIDQGLWNPRVEDELKDRVTKSVSAKTSAEERWKQINEQKQRMSDANAYDSHMRNRCEWVCETDAIKISDIRKKKEKEESTPLPPKGEAAIAEAVKLWNDTAADCSLPKLQKLTKARETSLARRLADVGGIEGWKTALAKVRASPFLTGATSAGFKASFDFVTRESSLTKLMEGNYDAKSNGSGDGPRSHRPNQYADAARELRERFDNET